MNDFSQLARERFSARSFDPTRDVTEEQINKILKAGLDAPTAVNYQPFRIWVFRSAEAKEKLLTATKMKFIGDAPVIFAIGGKEEGAWVRPYDEKNFADVDASIVATHMMLEIHDLGLGSTWIGHFDAAKVQELFPETAGYSLIALLPAAYMAEDCKPSERHLMSKTESELVEVL